MYFRNNKKTAQDISLNETIDTDKDGNPLTLIDIMASDNNIMDELELKINSEKINAYMNESLNDREREIIILRYGLDGSKPMTQREISDILKISRSYVIALAYYKEKLRATIH